MGSEEKKPRGKYAKLEEELVRSNQDFIDQQRRQQQACIFSNRLINMTRPMPFL